MNIHFITRHAPANYGSLLQTIAMQEIIGILGYDNEVIDYIPYEESVFRLPVTQARMKKELDANKLKKIAYIIVCELENWIMYHKFLTMRKEFLKMGPRCKNHLQLKNIYANNSEDIFITGSDQVWGSIATGSYDSAYFLDFVPKGARKLAFASSFGKSQFDETIMSTYKEYLSKYDKLAVREKVAVDIIHNLGFSSEQVLDPTLMMTKEQWEEYLRPIKKPEEYVLIYQIHKNSEMDTYAEKFAQEKGLPLLRVSPLLHQKTRSGKLVYLPDIGQFLDLIKNATYLVTDSFHGTVFALTFNTQFIEILPNTETSSRNLNLLELTNLTERIVKDLSRFDYADEQIDFTYANKIINMKRLQSINILLKYITDGE